MSVMTEREYLSPRKAAERAHVDVNTIYYWLSKPDGLKSHRPGGRGHYRIYPEDLDEYIGRTSGVEMEQRKG